jgi:hypothetical protein
LRASCHGKRRVCITGNLRASCHGKRRVCIVERVRITGNVVGVHHGTRCARPDECTVLELVAGRITGLVARDRTNAPCWGLLLLRITGLVARMHEKREFLVCHKHVVGGGATAKHFRARDVGVL